MEMIAVCEDGNIYYSLSSSAAETQKKWWSHIGSDNVTEVALWTPNIPLPAPQLLMDCKAVKNRLCELFS